MKKWLLALAALAVAIVSLAPTALASSPVIPGLTTAAPPEFRIQGDVQTLIAGKESKLSVTLSNTGGSAASNITIKQVLADDMGILVPDSASGLLQYASLAPGASIELDLKVLLDKTKVKAGYQQLSLSVTASHAVFDGTTLTTVEKNYEVPLAVLVEVPDDTLNPTGVRIEGATFTPSTLAAGGATKLRVLLSADVSLLSGDGLLVELSGQVISSATLTPANSQAHKKLNLLTALATDTLWYVEFDLTAAQAMKTGIYGLTVRVASSSKPNDELALRTFELPLTIEETAPTPAPKADLTLISAKQNTTKPQDNRLSLDVTVENTGTTVLENVRVSLSGLSQNALSLFGAYLPPVIESLKPGERKTMTFPLYAHPDLGLGNHGLKVDMTYEGNTASQDVFVFIDRPASTPTPAPTIAQPAYILVSQYTIESESGQVQAGQPFTFRFTLRNASTTLDVHNLSILFSSELNAFMPLEAANMLYVEKLAAGGSVELSIPLIAGSELEAKSHPLLLTMQYQDAANQSYPNLTEQISLPVTQALRLDLSDISFYANGVNQPGYLNFQIMNQGKAPVYNLSFTIEGPFQFESGSSSFYYGNLAGGSSDYYSDTIIPQQEGEVEGTVTLEYEDENGNPTTLRRTFSGHVMNWNTPEPGIEEPGTDVPTDGDLVDAKPGFKQYAIWGGAGLVIIIAGIVTLRIAAKRRRQRLEAEE